MLRATMGVVVLALLASPAFAPSGRYPSLDLLALTSERVELVRVVPPPDSSDASVLVGGRVVRYSVISKLIGDGPSPGSLGLDPTSVPVAGDTLLVFWHLWSRSQLDDHSQPREITAINLTDHGRSAGMPALTSDFGVPRSSGSALAIVLLRVAMVRAGCPLGDERQLSLTDFVEGRGCVERWIPEGSEAEAPRSFSRPRAGFPRGYEDASIL